MVTNGLVKALFVYQDERLPSSRVRVLNLIPELRSMGVDVTALCFPTSVAERFKVMRMLRNFDVVFIQKKLLNLIDAIVVHYLSRCLVYDFDDAIYYRDDSAISPYSDSRYRKFKRMMRISDVVIAGNKVLAEEASKYSKVVKVLPSSVPVENIIVKENYDHAGPIVIGWLGGGGNLHHLSSIGSAIQALARTNDIVVHVVSNKEFKLEGVKVVNIAWSLDDQEEQIARFDIGVMPLPDNWWTQGKCGYKALQYMASGVATICSAVGSNADMIDDGVDGFSAASLEDFHKAMQTLIDDSRMRQDMGLKAREKIKQKYSIQAVGSHLASILKDRVMSANKVKVT